MFSLWPIAAFRQRPIPRQSESTCQSQHAIVAQINNGLKNTGLRKGKAALLPQHGGVSGNTMNFNRRNCYFSHPINTLFKSHKQHDVHCLFTPYGCSAAICPASRARRRTGIVPHVVWRTSAGTSLSTNAPDSQQKRPVDRPAFQALEPSDGGVSSAARPWFRTGHPRPRRGWSAPCRQCRTPWPDPRS